MFGGTDTFIHSGIYANVDGTLGVVADTNTAIRGGSGNFATVVIPSISGSNVAFVGTDTFTNSGIYANVGGTLGVVADTNTAIPGGSGNFATLNGPSISGSNVAFYGTDSSTHPGIYADIGGTLEVVADTNTAIPGGSGNFVSFNGPSISGANVAFRGSDSSTRPGIYAYIDGDLMKVIDVTDTLDGKALAGLGFFPNRGLSGDSLAFQAFFSDSSVGIFRADLVSVPEPATLALLGIALAGLGFSRRRKLHRVALPAMSLVKWLVGRILAAPFAVYAGVQYRFSG